jgi:hypothetical protein
VANFLTVSLRSAPHRQPTWFTFRKKKKQMPPATRRRAARPTSSSTSFWHFYLREHARPLTRALHVAGTVGALTIATLANIRGWGWAGAGAALACGYGPAWASHFLVEKNRPASFRRPLASFAADMRMAALTLAGRLGPHLEAAGVTT